MVPLDLLQYVTNEKPKYYVDVYFKTFKKPNKNMKKIESEKKSTFQHFRYNEKYYYYIRTGGTSHCPYERLLVMNKKKTNKFRLYVDENIFRKPWPLDYPAINKIFRTMASENNGLLVHASGYVLNKKGLLFVGQSGAGKSTVAKLLIKKNIKNLLNDERIYIFKKKDKFYMCSTPWNGEVVVKNKKICPIHSIFFLKKNKEKFYIKKLNKLEILNRLLNQLFIDYHDKKIISCEFDTVDKMLNKLKFYDFHFKREDSIVDYLEKFISQSNLP